MRKVIRFFEKLIRINKIFTPARIIILGFIFIILFGAFLLHLPISTKSGESVPFLTALFTSTSATCVTGLIDTDTAGTWSLFGRIVILCLIQIGGLGFISVMSLFFLVTKKDIGLSQRLLIVQSLSLKDMKGAVKLVRHCLIGTFVIEGIGAIILGIRFAFDFGIVKGFGMGIFHSVSAFCNAGFDLVGDISNLGLNYYAGDSIICLTMSVLIIVGGLGFYVWEDIYQTRSFKKLHVYSKLVLIVSSILVVSGWAFYFIAEYNNPNTLGDLSTYGKLATSLFQSATTRTAGFGMINQMDLTDSSKFLTLFLMFIGGSSGSTAGGIKTVAIAILLLSAISTLRGHKRLSIFGRTVPDAQILSILSIVIIAICLIFTSTIIISIIESYPIFDVLFETISAMSTTGLSTGITPYLFPVSKILLIILMFYGRIGIMTIGIAISLNRYSVDKIKYPETRIMIG